MYVGIEEIREAAKNLSPSGLKLYLYFVENEDGWEFNLSPKDFQNRYDVAESTYRNAKRELIDKGYIVEEDKNHFTFYSNPEDGLISLDDLRKEIIKIAGHIKEYDINVYNYFNEEALKTKTLNEIEKRKAGIELLKSMRKELDRLEEINSTFSF